MKLRPYIIILLMLTLALPLLAQKRGWQPGYVVTIQGDTFKGQIKYGNNILSDARYDACHLIRFKNARGIRINFTPQFTRCYQRGTDFYLSYQTQKNNQTWAAFIKKVKTGPMDMYLYYGDHKSFMYFLKKPGTPFFILESDDLNLTFNRTKIKTAFNKYFFECDKVIKKIEDGTYHIYQLRLKSVPAMVDEYNRCF